MTAELDDDPEVDRDIVARATEAAQRGSAKKILFLHPNIAHGQPIILT